MSQGIWGNSAKALRYVALGCAALLIAVVIAPHTAMAQLAGQGAVTGMVTDSSGAVIPLATIAATRSTRTPASPATTTASR